MPELWGDMDSIKERKYDLKPITEAEITAKGLVQKDLWYLKFNENESGPYFFDHLYEYLKNNKNFDRSTNACMASERKWRSLEDYPQFQLVFLGIDGIDHAELKKAQFYLLINGIAHGPNSYEEIKNRLENGEILVTAPVSIDEGKHWIKICQHPLFDRRGRKDLESLPFLPENHSLAQSETSQNQKQFDEKEEKELIDIAQANKKEQSKSSEFQEEEKPTKNLRPTWKFIFALTLGLSVFSTGLYFFIKHNGNIINNVALPSFNKEKTKKISALKRAKNSRLKGPNKINQRRPANLARPKPKKRPPVKKALRPTDPYMEDNDNYNDKDNYNDDDPYKDDYAQDLDHRDPEIKKAKKKTGPRKFDDDIYNDAEEEPFDREIDDNLAEYNERGDGDDYRDDDPQKDYDDYDVDTEIEF